MQMQINNELRYEHYGVNEFIVYPVWASNIFDVQLIQEDFTHYLPVDEAALDSFQLIEAA